MVTWTLIAEYDGRSRALFYYPPISDDPHASNNRAAWYTMDGPLHSRKATHFSYVEAPAG